MVYTGFRNLKKSKPEYNKWVEVAHIISGAGAPEREGWFTTGRLRESGIWALKQTKNKKVTFSKPPTHWREMQSEGNF